MNSESPQDTPNPLASLSPTDRLRVGELIDEHESAQKSGRTLSAEQLCVDDMHLLAAVQVSLEKLASVDRKLLRPVSSRVPERIGEFEVLEQIGIGGSGFVFRCQQQNPDRKVAVKLFKPSLAADEQRRSFNREMQVCSALNAPGLAQVYTTGVMEWEGVRCFWMAMELVDGGTIQSFVRNNNCSRTQILQLFRDVCVTVQAAHRQGIIHRDLKPSNILIAADGRPRLVDFGVAAIIGPLGSNETTEAGNLIIGTAAWIAPEVIRGDVAMADTRSDIFSLGVILFQLLSGEHPYDVSDLRTAQAVYNIATLPAKHLSVVADDVSKDLDTFAARLIDADPAYRYQNLDTVIADIDRLLADQPIQARAVSPVEVLVRWARRRKLLTSAIMAILLAVALNIVTYVSSNEQLKESSRRLAANNEKLEQQSQVLQQTIQRLERSSANASLRRIQDLLLVSPELAIAQLEGIEEFPPGTRNFAWRYLRDLATTEYFEIPSEDGAISTIAFGHNDNLIATIGTSGRLRCRDLRLNARRFEAAGYCSTSKIRFSPDDEYVYAASTSGGIQKRRVADGELVETFLADTHCPRDFDLSDDGTRLIAVNDSGELISLNVETGNEQRRQLDKGEKIAGLWFQNEDQIVGLVNRAGSWKTWHADSLEVHGVQELSELHANATEIWQAQHCSTLAGCNGLLVAQRFSIAVGFRFQEDGEPVPTQMRLRSEGIKGLGFLPPNRAVVTGKNTTRIRDLYGNTPDRLIEEHGAPTSASAVALSGERIAIGGEDGTTRIYGVKPPIAERRVIRPFGEWENHAGDLSTAAACHPTAPRVIIGHRSGWLANVDLQSGETIDAFQIATATVWDAVFSPDASWVACGVGSVEQGGVYVYQLNSENRLCSDPPSPKTQAPQKLTMVSLPSVTSLAVSTDGALVIAGMRNGEVAAIDTSTWQIVSRWQAHERRTQAILAFQGHVVTGGTDGWLRQWDLTTFQLVREWKAHERRVSDIVRSSSGRIYTTSHDGTVGIWDREGVLIKRITGHVASVLCLALSPDDATLATGGDDFAIHLWDARTGDAQIQLRSHTNLVQNLLFTPQGLLSTSHDSTARLWGPEAQ